MLRVFKTLACAGTVCRRFLPFVRSIHSDTFPPPPDHISNEEGVLSETVVHQLKPIVRNWKERHNLDSTLLFVRKLEDIKYPNLFAQKLAGRWGVPTTPTPNGHVFFLLASEEQKSALHFWVWPNADMKSPLCPKNLFPAQDRIHHDLTTQLRLFPRDHDALARSVVYHIEALLQPGQTKQMSQTRQTSQRQQTPQTQQTQQTQQTPLPTPSKDPPFVWYVVGYAALLMGVIFLLEKAWARQQARLKHEAERSRGIGERRGGRKRRTSHGGRSA